MRAAPVAAFAALALCSAAPSHADDTPRPPAKRATTAAAAPPVQPKVDVARMSPKELKARIEASGWTTVGAPIQTQGDGFTSWIWAVTRGVSGGAVGLYQYTNDAKAAHLTAKLQRTEDAAVTRSGHTVLSVITTDRPQDANRLMRDLLEHTALEVRLHPHTPALDESGPPIASPALSDRPPPLPSTTLPEIDFKGRSRAELLHTALNAGWTLTAPPKVSDGAGYYVVTYALNKAADAGAIAPVTAWLSLYACTNAACTRQLAQVARTHDAAQARDSERLLMIVAPDDPDAARALLDRLMRQ